MRGLFLGGALAGFLIGIALGLAIAWVYWPVTYTDAEPADLRLDEKEDFIKMIAASYSVDGSMAQALRRLSALQLPQPSIAVANLARRETTPLTQQALLQLSLDLNAPAAALARPTYTPRPTRPRANFAPTPELPRITPAPPPSSTAAPTETPALAFSDTPTLTLV